MPKKDKAKKGKEAAPVKEEEADFISKKVNYMGQAISNKLPEDGFKTYSKLTTDVERFTFVWQLPDTQEIIKLEPEFETKSAEKARAFREKGNEYFQKQSYVTALGEYNASIKFAPEYDPTKCSNGDVKCDTSNPNEENTSPNENNQTEKTSTNQNGVQEKPVDETGGEKVSIKEPPKNELALAYANRSAALFHLKRYHECLRDIELAFESKYAEELHHKLYERQGASFQGLGRIDDALASFQKALDSLSAADLSPKAKNTRTQALEKLLDGCKKMENKPVVATDDVLKIAVPALTGEKNSSYPRASHAVKVQYNNVVGRHTVAERDVKVGDILISESPFASIVFPGIYSKVHCYNCFARIRSPVPCKQCSAVSFCSRDCQSSAWKTYHWAECTYGELLTPETCAKIGHLAMRLVMTIGLEPLLTYLKNGSSDPVNPEKVGLNSEGVYEGNFDAVHNLVTNSKSRKVEDLFDFTVSACVIMKVMEASGYLQPIAGTPGDVELVGGAVLRYLQIIQCNAKRIMELSWPEKFDDPKPVYVGVGLYPTVALVNHSCDPNADLNFYGNSVVVRAIRNIAEGEEICISYGSVFYEVKQRTRASQLKGAFFFTCKCDACFENFPIAEEMFNELPRYRCEKCRSLLVVEDKFEKKYFTCAICKHKQDMEELVGKLQQSFDVFARAMNSAMTGRHEEALPGFVQHLLLLQTHIRHPWRDLASCQSAIKQCFRLTANTKER